MAETSEVWRAKGYALWLVSDQFAEVTMKFRQEISMYFPEVNPVSDGHLTIVGNIQEQDKLLMIQEKLLAKLNLVPLTLNFTGIILNPSKPSQTFALTVNSRDLEAIYCDVLKELGMEYKIDHTPFHASLVYNIGSNYPVKQENISLLEKIIGKGYSCEATFNRVIVMQTLGIPNEWKEVLSYKEN